MTCSISQYGYDPRRWQKTYFVGSEWGVELLHIPALFISRPQEGKILDEPTTIELREEENSFLLFHNLAAQQEIEAPSLQPQMRSEG